MKLSMIFSGGYEYAVIAANLPSMDAMRVVCFEVGSPVKEWKCCAFMKFGLPVLMIEFQFFEYMNDVIVLLVMVIWASRNVNVLLFVCSGMRSMVSW